MAKRTEQDIDRERIEDMAWVMSSERGRRLMWWLLGETGLYESIFRQPSPMVMAAERLVYNGAKRDFGQWLQSELRRICPTQFDTMGLEARVQKALEREPVKPTAPANEEETE